MEVNILRSAGLADAIPDALGPMGIMIAGNEVPLHVGEAAHPLDRLKQGLRRGRLRVVDITSNENMFGVLSFSQLPNFLDGGEARLSEYPFLVTELLEGLADFPVGCMDDAHRSSLLSIRNGRRQNDVRDLPPQLQRDGSSRHRPNVMTLSPNYVRAFSAVACTVLK
jgi:hypothetical protein